MPAPPGCAQPPALVLYSPKEGRSWSFPISFCRREETPGASASWSWQNENRSLPAGGQQMGDRGGRAGPWGAAGAGGGPGHLPGPALRPGGAIRPGGGGGTPAPRSCQAAERVAAGSFGSRPSGSRFPAGPLGRLLHHGAAGHHLRLRGQLFSGDAGGGSFFCTPSIASEELSYQVTFSDAQGRPLALADARCSGGICTRGRDPRRQSGRARHADGQRRQGHPQRPADTESQL